MDIIGLIPSFGGLIWTLAAFVVALSIIVAVHEYGHYIVGRWSGIHAEVFSLGFGPVLFSRVDRRGTRWQVALLPLGGYVKFLGDADAASATADSSAIAGMDPAARRRTMQGAPLWARAATVAAGPFFNFVMSIIVFAGFFMVQGVATDVPTVGRITDLPTASQGTSQGLAEGDRILAIEGRETPDYPAFYAAAGATQPAPTVDYRVLRDDRELVVEGPFPLPPLVGTIQLQSAAAAADLEPGDVILSVNGEPISSFDELPERVAASGGQSLLLEVWRGGETFEVTLVPRRSDVPTASGGFETRWLIGITSAPAFEPETRATGPFEALNRGVQQTVFIAQTSLSGLWHMVTGAISSCNLRGPIGIAETSGAAAAQGVESFVWFIAVLSTAVGLLNLFPVPVLDGGHLVFHAWEAVTGRPPSERALRILMTAGFAMLLTLMIFALTNDIFCP
ncbi:RIP metalloprotease RseP [Halodurantibacterium flavum]|uniref:Zinc metalloprotease n=1 Tax=Halodurantibacterium flavum TaxID=1382802 RepID=A0ABW4SCV6_9RHOB